MSTFKDLKSILEDIIHWESGLKDFYDVAEVAMHDEKSKIMIRLLRSNHVKNLEIIKKIDVEEYGKDEWMKFTPEHNVRDLIPIDKIKRESPPLDICRHILDYEKKIMDVYKNISEKIINRDEKELFSSLVSFKDMQILEIHKLVEYIEYL